MLGEGDFACFTGAPGKGLKFFIFFYFFSLFGITKLYRFLVGSPTVEKSEKSFFLSVIGRAGEAF